MLDYCINVERAPEELREGLLEIIADFPNRFETGTPVTFVHESSLHGLRVNSKDSGLEVIYGRKIDAFRALGRLLAQEGPSVQDFAETCRFDMMGTMIDCSRNGVLLPSTVRDFLRRCALMGINMMHLYCEDTYEIPSEPFFGYMRGRYTYDELKSIDDYACSLGIEMIPCIQTLSHLDQIFQWKPYRHLEDSSGVILTGDDEAYELLAKMVAAASAPFRSKRINLGMDEAFEMGEGRYKQLHGERPKPDILNEHVARMCRICEAQGLKPTIWGDMHFVAVSPEKEYYDKSIVFPDDYGQQIPDGIQLVYWDYYHQDIDYYLEWIDRYRALGKEPAFNTSAWTHVRLWASLQWAFKTIGLGMDAARQKGLRECMISLWGDDGTEVDYYSALPAMQLFTEWGYADKVDMEQVKRNFRGSCGASMDGFVEASKIDYFDFRTDGRESFSNHSKWLLYQDLMLGLMDPQLEDMDLRTYYTDLAKTLESFAQEGGLAERLKYPAAIARALSLKTHLRRDLKSAYEADDRERLKQLVDGDLAELQKAVRELWMIYRNMWLTSYKPFGLESVEQRYGGLMARLETAAYRINSYLSGEVENIPELEQEPMRLFEQPVEHVWVPYRRVCTPSFIK